MLSQTKFLKKLSEKTDKDSNIDNSSLTTLSCKDRSLEEKSAVKIQQFYRRHLANWHLNKHNIGQPYYKRLIILETPYCEFISTSREARFEYKDNLTDKTSFYSQKLNKDLYEYNSYVSKKVSPNGRNFPFANYHHKTSSLMYGGKIRRKNFYLNTLNKFADFMEIRKGTSYEAREVELKQLMRLHSVDSSVLWHVEEIINKAKGYDLRHAIPVIQMPNGALLMMNGHHRVEYMKKHNEKTIPAYIISWENLTEDTKNKLQTWEYRHIIKYHLRNQFILNNSNRSNTMQTRLNEKQIETYYCNVPTIMNSLHAQSTMLSKITQPLEEIIKLFKKNDQNIHPENLTVECLAHYLGRIYLIGESSNNGCMVVELVEELSKKMEIFDEVLKVKNSITYQTLVDEQKSRIYPTYSANEFTKRAVIKYLTNNSFFSEHESPVYNTKFIGSIEPEKKLREDGVEGKINAILNDLFGTKCSYNEWINTIEFIHPKSAEELRKCADQLIAAGLTVKIEEKKMLSGIIEVPAKLRVIEKSNVILEKLLTLSTSIKPEKQVMQNTI